MATERFLSDSARTSNQQDQLDRSPFASHVADLVRHHDSRESLSIGIFGEWGSGKSYVLNLIEKELAPHQYMRCIRFSPWLFDNDVGLIAALLASLLDAARAEKKLYKALKGPVFKFGKRLASAVSVSANLGAVQAGIDFEKLLKQDTRDPTSAANALREQVETALLQSKLRFVVFIDDLDRMSQADIRSFFRLIKLALDLPRVTYIVAADEQIVSSALSEGQEKLNRAALDKFIQVPIDLPDAAPRLLLDFSWDCLQAALATAGCPSPKESKDWKELREDFLEFLAPVVQTPRAAKRLANAVVYPLTALKDEANHCDLILLIALRVLDAPTYERIFANRELFLSGRPPNSYVKGDQLQKERDSALEKILGETPEPMKGQSLRILQRLFPQIRGAGGLDSTYEQKRVCSPYFFDEYFTHTTTKYGVREAEVDTVLMALEKQPLEQAEAALTQLLGEHNWPTAVMALRQRAYHMKATVAKQVFLSLTKQIERVKDFHKARKEGDLYDLYSALQIVFCRIAEKQERIQAAQVALKSDAPLVNRINLLTFLERPRDEQTNNCSLPDEIASELNQQLAKESQDQCTKDALNFRNLPSTTTLLLWQWARVNGVQETTTHILNILKSDPGATESFLARYNSTWHSGRTSSRYFDDHSLERVIEVVDVVELAAFVRKHKLSNLVADGSDSLSYKNRRNLPAIDRFLLLVGARQPPKDQKPAV